MVVTAAHGAPAPRAVNRELCPNPEQGGDQ
jgi:hypothetical protein